MIGKNVVEIREKATLDYHTDRIQFMRSGRIMWVVCSDYEDTELVRVRTGEIIIHPLLRQVRDSRSPFMPELGLILRDARQYAEFENTSLIDGLDGYDTIN
jgi:hypothetical protein